MSQRVRTACKRWMSGSFARPDRTGSSIRTVAPMTSAPAILARSADARSVPPVASRSSTMSTRLLAAMSPAWISKRSAPYSSWYSTWWTGRGSFPALRIGTNPADRAWAMAVPKMKPRDSAPKTSSTLWPRNGFTISSTASASAAGSAKSGVKSLNTTPGLGKSGTSRMKASNWSCMFGLAVFSVGWWDGARIAFVYQTHAARDGRVSWDLSSQGKERI